MRLIFTITLTLLLCALVFLDQISPWPPGIACVILAGFGFAFRDLVAGAILFFIAGSQYTETDRWTWAVPILASGLAVLFFLHGWGWL